MMNIRKATQKDLKQLSQLFDGYRQFYQQATDLDGARDFIQLRMENNQSVIFVAEQQDKLLGFTQLFPSYSSVSLQCLWILNDLFVAATAREQGVAEALMHAARDFAESTHSKGIILETDWDNVQAQKLYDKLGYQKQESTYHYFLPSQVG
ncbi:GNAT family N-acetyltransferase [Marinicella sp. S1101]|uniref:GNAT family N-acetyltransferase n=1 Tax=Marinicella marina TaxID=2996016 RepID=UPI00226103C9|nr:GNAT family N-acetyltransferase [Marinicella marina]MCX7552490.1 GNAT family N-acetyltransferase [Marinicella marina]MDJ1139366.1 GNAT family N-acetyltransferase [Marinicella marina]